MLRASAFAPGHVTGFFVIHDDADDIRQKGSRGAGICLSLGVNSEVHISESGSQSIEIFINNKVNQAPVTRHAVKSLIDNKPLEVRVYSKLDLPMGQGFGMSAAGALSSSLALAHAMELGFKRDKIICAAHGAEVRLKTGLGDVFPQSKGGVVVRKKEGCPPFGRVKKISTIEKEVVLCVIGKEISTRSIITDPDYRARINEYGNLCLGKLLVYPTLGEMMRLSYEFAKKTNLMSKDLEEAISAVSSLGRASMSMLGNSIFGMGKIKEMAAVLEDHGDVYICKIDDIGMRLV